MKLRKISRTPKGARLLNLSGFIPEDWEYVEITGQGYPTNQNPSAVMLRLDVVRVEKARVKVPKKISLRS